MRHHSSTAGLPGQAPHSLLKAGLKPFGLQASGQQEPWPSGLGPQPVPKLAIVKAQRQPPETGENPFHSYFSFAKFMFSYRKENVYILNGKKKKTQCKTKTFLTLALVS